jgi:ATP-dependent Clp protease ATP-binding subunit ClpX
MACTTLPTPLEMMAYLDRFVHGQQRAKRDLAVAVYNHYLGVGLRAAQARAGVATDAQESDFGKQHVLLMGPTGSGKTYMVRLLADFLGLPYCFHRANALVKTGYVGTSMEMLIGAIFTRAGEDVERAQRAIVFLDEIDKIQAGQTSELDISGAAVQQQLLPILDGVTVSAFSDRAATADKAVDIDTSGMLFVCTGAFVGLPKIIRGRLSGGRMGFLSPDEMHGVEDLFDDAVMPLVAPEDLMNFGFIPEFIGRFTTLTSVAELATDDLVAILLHTEGSILPKQQRLFALHGITLEVAPEAVTAVAEEAKTGGTGARGLTRILLRCLDGVDYRLPELAREGVTRVTITRDVVQARSEPLLERSGTPRGDTDADRIRAAVFSGEAAGGPSVSGAGLFGDPRAWTADQLNQVITYLQALRDAREPAGV